MGVQSTGISRDGNEILDVKCFSPCAGFYTHSFKIPIRERAFKIVAQGFSPVRESLRDYFC